jgi:multiple sugar transport system ATP-binding protein
VRKVFDGGQVAVDDVDLSIADGQRIVLVGPSGSGKSTLLRLIAGLEAASSGRVRIGDRDVTGVPPEHRDLAMVFQSYALYPHMTVRENLGFGLRMRRVPGDEIVRRVQSVAGTLGLEALLDRRPAALSGGQRQRVALGRAIVREPQAFLFDEPLSNLDPRLRGDARAELIGLHQRLGATIVYVTHDQEEAMTIGQRIAVMRDGRIVQVAAPMELYERPVDTFVAGFIGSPPMNLIAGRLETIDGTPAFVSAGSFAVALAPGAAVGPHAPGTPVTLGVRPQDVEIGDRPDDAGGIRMRIEVVEPLGHSTIVHAAAEAFRLVAVVPADARPTPGDIVTVALRPDRLHLFDSGSGLVLRD